jgi:ABC-2 type transport system permease protein
MHVGASATVQGPSRLDAVNASRHQPLECFQDGPSLAERWYARHPELRPATVDGRVPPPSFAASFFLVQEEMDRRAPPIEAQIEAAVASRQDFVDRWRWISPAIVLREAFNDLAGTSLRRHLRYRAQGEAYRQRWREFFGPRLLRGAAMTRADYDAIPAFIMSEEPFDALLRRLSASAGVVCALAGAVAGACALRSKGSAEAGHYIC